LEFPEHSRQGYDAAARMGAGECLDTLPIIDQPD
jgi:hypothetical protein